MRRREYDTTPDNEMRGGAANVGLNGPENSDHATYCPVSNTHRMDNMAGVEHMASDA